MCTGDATLLCIMELPSVCVTMKTSTCCSTSSTLNPDRCVCLQALAQRLSADIAVPSDVFKTSKNRIQRRQLDAFARDWRAAETNEERKELIERQKRVVQERTEVRPYIYSQQAMRC